MKKMHTLILLSVLPLLLTACLKNLPGGNAGTTESTQTREEILADQLANVQGTPAPGSDTVEEAVNWVEINAGANSIPAGLTFDNPWDYCQAVGTISSPGIEYAGKTPYDAVTTSILQAMNIDTSEVASHISIWRCANGQVWGCDSSTYPQCPNQVDFSTEPSDIMKEECAKSEMENVVLPGAVTGRDTAYEWVCKAGIPEISGQAVSADEFGFNANIWFPVMKQ
ncbi:MAG: hypothetical protein AB9907_12620 [Flexilinea sp.]